MIWNYSFLSFIILPIFHVSSTFVFSLYIQIYIIR